jgi:hypothetical protein
MLQQHVTGSALPSPYLPSSYLPSSLATHPALASLLAGTKVVTGASVEALGPNGIGMAVSAPHTLCIGPRFADRAGALTLLRFGLELAWMRAVPGLAGAAATLLAARAAGCFSALQPRAVRDAMAEDPIVPLFTRLAGDMPPIAQLTSYWRLLAEAGADTEEPPDLHAYQQVEHLWSLALPTEALLVEGGDDRLLLNPQTAQNRYLCTPWPRPGIIAFSSCTASSISPAAFAAAEQARQDLFAAAVTATQDAVLATASDQITAELLVHCGAEDLAEAVLAASGTDATLLLTGLLAAEQPRKTITTVLMSPAETGSGVPEAVQGRHFAACTASGLAVEKGGAVEGFPPGLAMVSVALRTTDGAPRDEAAIAADCEAAIEAASHRGHVVLQAIDGSKTGLAAPHLLALDLLAARYRGKLDIVIDACQFRIEPEILRGYLERGWPVLVTGSKFFGAPGFCGAVLFPRARLRRIAGAGRVPDGLGAYTHLSNGSISRRCPGLLLRWTAALTQMRAFATMPATAIRNAIDSAGAHTRAAMMRQPRLQIVPAPRPSTGAWSDRPSVLTFCVRGPQGLLSAASLRPIYLDMAADCTDRFPAASDAAKAAARTVCLLGQPVQLGSPSIGGLRIAFSAAQIVAGEDVRPALAVMFAKLAMLLEA